MDPGSSASRYGMLVRVLDGVRDEARGTKHESRYAVGSADQTEIWQARARAYIHLYLKVMFGIQDFENRETYVTDGGRDGGVDGYFIDTDTRIIYILQSKFRNTEQNFEAKPIELEELLAMQIRRVLGGDDKDDQGYEFNGKIRGFQRRISEIYDIGRYTHKVIILANLRSVSEDNLKKLTDNLQPEVIDYTKAYALLLYPVLSGTLFKAAGLGITIDLSNKSSGSKIGYNVSAEDVDCEITVVFVPALEIGRIMSMYKNSILTFNPRSYLEFQGEKVNAAIRDSILETQGNDFALLNNGITIICDESSVNEQSGRKHKAQLFLLNPQIINGGQTAYTLSRIYEDLDSPDRENTFAGKEVMVKAIAVELPTGGESEAQKRTRLIEKISTATNSQTAVTIADRTSGDPLNILLQETLFDRYGILYERKRGEFNEGLRLAYIKKSDITDRAHFARLYLTANSTITRALRKRVTIQDLPLDVATNSLNLENYILARTAFEALDKGASSQGTPGYLAILPLVKAACVHARRLEGDATTRGSVAAAFIESSWEKFLARLAAIRPKYVRIVIDPVGNQRVEIRDGRRFLTDEFDAMIETYFGEATVKSPTTVQS